MPAVPHYGTCSGEEFAAFTGCATLTSYLFLFLAFYAATYKKSSTRKKRSLSAVASDIPRAAAIDFKTTKVPTACETGEAASEALHVLEGAMKTASTQIAHDLHLTGHSHE